MSLGELPAPRPSAASQETLDWLFGTQLFGIKLGLESIRRLFDALEVPGAAQRIIHVAGTNGKGSVCAMIDSICRAAGYRTGLFTSPHLVTYRERIRVNGELISAEAVTEGLTLIRELVREWEPHPTFFEITTALALWHFKRAGCELVVLETGMGGRLDATNAVRPVVSVLTPIGLDHQKWLGHTLVEIAREKAGIIKRGVPVVSASQPAEAEAVLRQAREDVQWITSSYDGEIGLCGAHQRANAALAVAAVRAAHINIPERAITAGLTSVQWPARFQQWNDRTIIDGAHNPAGARVAVETWRQTFGNERATLILGLMRDKDAAGMWRELSTIAARVILPHFRGERVLPPGELHLLIDAETEIASDIGAALRRAEEYAERVLIAGSLHLAGEALVHLSGTPAAFEECAQ
ncbi:MAG: bifunctional folylpolyglutamate synthase/dihydrofolate synthase [Chthoniobacterales bacterium]|nr:bifunctional folylpolyglutamate synthase/dihydrofolate synthase [Chthoniobacterales bacterium]